MPKKRVWQLGIATWLWMVLVIATFFLGRSWDDSWGPLLRQMSAHVTGLGQQSNPPGLTVTIPAMEPAQVTIDIAQLSAQRATDFDSTTMSFFVGFNR